MSDKDNDGIDRRPEVPIELDFPVEIDGNLITTLTMRRAKLRDQFKMARAKGSTEFEKGSLMMCDLTSQPQEVLLELDEYDAAKIQAQLEAFTGRTLTP